MDMHSTATAERMAPVAAAVPDSPARPAPRRAGRLATLAGTAAVLALAVHVSLSSLPDALGDTVMRQVRVAETGPMFDRLVAGLPAEGKRLFQVPPDAETVARLLDRADVLNHRGLALFDRDGAAIWRSAAGAASWAEDGVRAAARTGQTEILHQEIPGDAAGEIEHRTAVIVPITDRGETLGVIVALFEDGAEENAISALSRILLLVILGIAVLTGTALLVGISRSQRIRAEAERRVLVTRNAMLAEQLRMGREMSLLAELNEWLQSCRDLQELYRMVVRFLDVLLPGSSGSIYIYSNSRDVLDGAISWGGAVHHGHIHPHDSWALRRGRTYEFGQAPVAFACTYIHEPSPRPYLSIPFLAHGETVGLLHITYPQDQTEPERARFRRMAQTCAEQISLAIANVKMRDQLQDQSIRDPLTGLYNRRHLTDSLRRALVALPRTGRELAVIAIDVDLFKRFNDNHGHDAGDMVLRAVGAALTQLCDGDELACRIGGEELMVMLPDTTVEAAMQRAEAMRAAVESISVRYGEKTLPRVTISLGVAVAPRHGALPQDLMRAADDALYAAKDRGRNQAVLADPGAVQPPAPPADGPPPFRIAAE